MKRDRRQQILWDLIDEMFAKVEYWDEKSPLHGDINDEERDYLMKTISAFCKKVNVTNHVLYKGN